MTDKDRKTYLDTIEQRFFKVGEQFTTVGRGGLRAMLHDALHIGAMLYADTLEERQKELRQDAA